jgi:hypothetical protein
MLKPPPTSPLMLLSLPTFAVVHLLLRAPAQVIAVPCNHTPTKKNNSVFVHPSEFKKELPHFRVSEVDYTILYQEISSFNANNDDQPFISEVSYCAFPVKLGVVY